MLRLGLTLGELAGLIGYSRSYTQKMILGECRNEKVRSKIEHVLGGTIWPKMERAQEKEKQK